MEQQNNYIDLKTIWQLVIANQKHLLKIFLGIVIFFLLLAFLLPKKYTSTVLIRTKQSQPIQPNAAVLALVGGNVQNQALVYLEMLRSRSVLDPVIAAIDLPAEEKEKIDNVIFAKAYMQMQVLKGTDLIELSVMGDTPEDAQNNASLVINSFKSTLTQLNRSEQSNLLRFFKERMTVSEEEMNKAAQELENFKQAEKIFVPDDQAKVLIEGMSIIDRQIAEKQVAIKVSQSTLYEVKKQLSKQNEALLKYNVTDNESFRDIYAKLAEKQMTLIDLQQRYTDKHPLVILAKNEIKDLNAYLKNEISSAIKSEATTLNPLHFNLLEQKVLNEIALETDSQMVNALQIAKNREEEKMSSLSENSLKYINLAKNEKVAREVYSYLAKSYEEARIKEAMESMDIQVIDEPNVPLKHSRPQRLFIVAGGIFLAVIVCLGRIMYMYYRPGKLVNH